MHKVNQVVLAGLVALAAAAQPSSAAQGSLEAAWSDTAGSTTLVDEEACTSVNGPLPYNVKCTISATATSLPGAIPKRGQCTEVLATTGQRTLGGPCEAQFTIAMRLHRVRLDRQPPAVYLCNGTSLDQLTDSTEPVRLKGSYTYENVDGLFRSVDVDVTVVNNVVSFQGSVARVGTEDVVDEVEGTFPIRCRASTGSGFAGTYKYVI